MLAAPPRGYRLVRALDTGAFATTFDVERDEARDGSGPRGSSAVCKRLSARFRGDPEAAETIAREARVLSLLAGRGSPLLLDHGRDEHGPFLVMARARGCPLRAFVPLAAPRSEPWRDAWSRAAERAFAALAQVHEASDERGPLAIVHGDLSPDNVFVSEPSATLLDFGLASWRGEPAPTGGSFRGTLRYVAPEVARGEPFDLRADLFALAASLAHAASGKAPRERTSAAALLVCAGQDPLDAYAREALSSFHPGLADRLARCLSFSPQDRPSRARDVFPPSPC